MITDINVALCNDCDETYFILYGNNTAEIKKCNCVDPSEFDWINMQ